METWNWVVAGSSLARTTRTGPARKHARTHAHIHTSSSSQVGNEARFVNDYRNTGRRANVEFRLRRDRRGELRQGVYVAAKAGVAAGEELLINYGKPFWRARAGGRSLEEFVRVRPHIQAQ